MNRADVERFDREDPLASFRDRFVIPDPDLVYADGNSLGRLPKATVARLRTVIEHEWGGNLIRSWDEWMTWPAAIGDRLGRACLGAGSGQVLISDSTTVNFYKLAAAALDARPDRRVVVTDRDNFPTDRYVLEGLAAGRGLGIRWASVDDPEAEIDDDVALVTFSHVSYRTAAIADMNGITAAAHDRGALVLWDLSHSVGSVAVGLDEAGVDLAVGCTYKYLNAGPGAPAFLYVRRDLQEELVQPIWGWFGQRDQFEMGPAYDPAPGIGRYLGGTPPILGLAAVDEGVALVEEAGIEAIAAKGRGLTTLAAALVSDWLAPLGCSLAGQVGARARGAHVAVIHPEARRLTRQLIEQANVVPDFRPPDIIRFGFSPLTTRYIDVWEAMARLRALLS